ncbi:replication initiation protein [Lichenihabitans sp. Uapishka_5]|uniref:replication initiation protein n=1 Tax=Lichenihabitans sp. Uapishka_5 TaxID=3037302 RepID=UPI0029E801A8|nr:replication initiation protein [Lichenihabitans sp. Uapishka_5]MDX7951805.1 replication initiation protein [Lichenihabitans sp. Uapishka_5]
MVLQLTPNLLESLKPQELIQIKGHAELTLNARRAITILWHNAHRQGIREGRDYTIEIDDLKTDGHKGYEPVVEAVEALMTTFLIFKDPNDPDGDDYRVQFLGGNNMTPKGRPGGVLTYSFDKRLIALLEASVKWGQISLPVLMSFSSKYAISLYENVTQSVNLRHISNATYTIDEFREMMGVPAGRYAVYGDLNRHVIKPSVSEINALAHFEISVLPIKKGKKVDQIMVAWMRKSQDAATEALRERERPRLGRRVRLANRVEHVADAVPSVGRMMRDDRKQRRSPKTS